MIAPSRRAVLAGLAAALLLPRWARAGRPLLLVLTSGASPRTEAILGAVEAGTEDANRVIYELGPEVEAAAFLADGTRDLAINAVLAVGDRAFVAAAREFANLPLIYADVHDTSAAAGRPNVVGLSLRPDPAQGLTHLRGVFPQLKTLGLVRGARDADAAWWTGLESAAAEQKIVLEVKTASSVADLGNAMTALLARADAVWVQPDPQLWTGAVVGRTLYDASLAHKPVIGLDRSWLAAVPPAPFVLEASAVGIGQAAAAAARRALGLTDTAGGSSFPEPWLVGSKLAVRNLGLPLRKAEAALVQEWVD